jgi:hypothetical protein
MAIFIQYFLRIRTLNSNFNQSKRTQYYKPEHRFSGFCKKRKFALRPAINCYWYVDLKMFFDWLIDFVIDFIYLAHAKNSRFTTISHNIGQDKYNK